MIDLPPTEAVITLPPEVRARLRESFEAHRKEGWPEDFDVLFERSDRRPQTPTLAYWAWIVEVDGIEYGEAVQTAYHQRVETA